ncbi:MAG: DNA repair protein RecN [Dehalococcoidia bacterium]
MAPMLIELTVRNFAVIAETRMAPGPALNVITGETGAGKSLLVDALEFVLGGRADRDLIRGGAEKAFVEAVFQLPRDAGWREKLSEHGVELDEDGTLVLAREVHREGRSLCRINGRTVPVGTIREAGALLVDIHGQGTHLSLLDPRYQLAVLDAYAGLDAQREAVAAAVAKLRQLQHELAQLEAAAEQAEHQRDLLKFQVDEIESAGMRPGEEAELLRERGLLTHAQAVQEACAAAYEALYDGAANANDLIGRALLVLGRSPDPDGGLAAHMTPLEAAAAHVEEAARGLRAYAEAIEDDPARLEAIEERLELLKRLKRKYAGPGASEDAVLAFAVQAARELDGIEHADERRAALAAEMETATQDAGTLASHLSGKRAGAAQAIAQAVAQELAGLGMERAAFTAELRQAAAPDGLPGSGGERYAYNRTGIDEAEFLVETNKGEGFKPLAKVASGGETSRMLLAIKGALRAASGMPTLVFDEIDTGVGGRAGNVVGYKLWELARVSQVLCVTHLPQIAAFADSHFRVGKEIVEDRTYANAEALSASARVDELAAMLGGGPSASLDGAARELLERAAAFKRKGDNSGPAS